MADWHVPQGPFDIPDVPNFIPRQLKPYLFILFVLIIQFSSGVYLAAASDMVGTTALMQEDILMAGYASLILPSCSASSSVSLPEPSWLLQV